MKKKKTVIRFDLSPSPKPLDAFWSKKFKNAKKTKKNEKEYPKQKILTHEIIFIRFFSESIKTFVDAPCVCFLALVTN